MKRVPSPLRTWLTARFEWSTLSIHLGAQSDCVSSGRVHCR